jgi:predicted Zn-dependent protease with MMP-like domain
VFRGHPRYRAGVLTGAAHRTVAFTDRQAVCRFRNVIVTRRRFEELVADALDDIPEELGEHMENVAVVVEDWPSATQTADRPGTLLGLYEGVALTNRGPISYAGALPDRITLFRGPLCRISADERELADNVWITIVHEVGHHFGLSDERLRELGWA